MALLLAAVIWGSTFFIIKDATSSLSTAHILALRFAVQAVVVVSVGDVFGFEVCGEFVIVCLGNFAFQCHFQFFQLLVSVKNSSGVSGVVAL